MFLATTLFQTVRTTVLDAQNRNARRQAIRSALKSVTSTHSDQEWVGFDEHFLENGAAGLMTSFVNSGQLPTPEMLTSAWVAQFPYSNATAQKAVTSITPMVTDFVNLLATEQATEQIGEVPTETLGVQQQPMSVAENFA